MIFRESPPQGKQVETIKINKEPFFDVRAYPVSEEEVEYIESKQKELDSFLDSVDRTLVASIIKDIYIKSFGDTALVESKIERMLYILKKRIEVKYSGRMRKGGDGQASSSGVEISSGIVGVLGEIELLHVIIHELVHTSGETKDGVSFLKGKDFSEKYLNLENQFAALNESLTERITDYILSEYFKRSGDKNNHTAFEKKVKLAKAYTGERMLLDDILDRVSKDTNIPKDVVLQSLFGHYMRGDFEDAISQLSEEEMAYFERLKGDSGGIIDVLLIVIKKIIKDRIIL
jgi:hypothetical protein